MSSSSEFIQSSLNQYISSGAVYKVIFFAFLGGFLSSLTPCVYPLIPITLAIFGARDEVSRIKSFFLSLSYILGIASTYTLLGLISASTGMLFGSLANNNFVIFLVCVFLFTLLLFTLDEINLSVISKFQTKAQSIGGKGFLGGFVMGAASGVVAAPCIGPVLIILLGIASQSGNIIFGTTLLFAYSLGLGTIFIVLGTFSNLIKYLPKSGNWLSFVKFILACGVASAIFVTIRPLISTFYDTFNSTLTVAIVFILALIFSHFGYHYKKGYLKVLGSLTGGLFIFFLFMPPSQILSASANSTQDLTSKLKNEQKTPKIFWLTGIEEGMVKANTENKDLIIVDLFADWCTACKELDAYTFSEKAVIDQLKNIVTVRVDFTDENKTTEYITKKYNIIGLPTILFLDKNGDEIKKNRITGYVNSNEFLKHLVGIIPEQVVR